MKLADVKVTIRKCLITRVVACSAFDRFILPLKSRNSISRYLEWSMMVTTLSKDGFGKVAAGKIRERLGLIHNASYDSIGVDRRVLSDIASDNFEVLHSAPRLFGEPFAEASFCLFLRDGAIHASVFQASAYFVQDVEVVLNVLDRAVIRELVKQLFNIVLGCAHTVSLSKHSTSMQADPSQRTLRISAEGSRGAKAPHLRLLNASGSRYKQNRCDFIVDAGRETLASAGEVVASGGEVW
jgi:hypothetical protein